MSFGDFAKKAAQLGASAAKSVADSAKQKVERINMYKERYDTLDNAALIKKFKSSSGEQRMACIMLLRERGYGENMSQD